VYLQYHPLIKRTAGHQSTNMGKNYGVNGLIGMR